MTWFALAKAAVCLYGLLMALGVRLTFLVRTAYGNRAAAMLSGAWFVGQSVLLISLNYPWHASMAEQFGMYALMAGAPLCRASPLNRAERLECWMHMAGATTVLLLSKPNTAYPVVVLWVAVLGWRMGEWRSCAATLVTSLLAASSILATAHVTVWSMLQSYMGLGGRLLPKAFANGILYTLYARYGLANLLTYAILAPATATGLIWSWRHRGEVRGDALALLGLGGVLVSVVGMGTNFDYKLTDAPLCLLGLTLLWVGTVERVPGLQPRLVATAATLLFVGVFYGRTRLRMQTLGTWADDRCERTVEERDRFLRGVEVCREVQQAVDLVDTRMQTSGKAAVFFGPELEFLYADQGVTSPEGLPNWWDPGTSFPKRDARRITAAWDRAHFEALYFAAAEDRAQMPEGIGHLIERDYRLVTTTPELHIYARR